MSQIACEGIPSLPSGDPLTGFWFATREGLYQLDEAPNPGFEPALRSLVLPSVPVALEKETRQPELPGFGSRRKVEARGGSWCVTDSSWGGDEGWPR